MWSNGTKSSSDKIGTHCTISIASLLPSRRPIGSVRALNSEFIHLSGDICTYYEISKFSFTLRRGSMRWANNKSCFYIHDPIEIYFSSTKFSDLQCNIQYMEIKCLFKLRPRTGNNLVKKYSHFCLLTDTETYLFQEFSQNKNSKTVLPFQHFLFIHSKIEMNTEVQ